jgi:hypothetical protein
MDIPCEGGMLDGKTVKKVGPEKVIHQTGIWLLRVHKPYPKRKGERVTERLMTYTEDYALTMTDAGPVYRCAHPIAGLSVGDELLTPTEGGGYDVWVRPDGTLSPRPPSTEEAA